MDLWSEFSTSFPSTFLAIIISLLKKYTRSSLRDDHQNQIPLATMRTSLYRIYLKLFVGFNQTDFIFQRFLRFDTFSNLQFKQRDS